MRCALVINDIAQDVIEAESIEWCNNHLDGVWLAVPDCVGIGDSIYKRLTAKEALQTRETLKYYYDLIPRGTRVFQVLKVIPMSEADNYRSLVPVPIELLCTSQDFFLVPTSLIKNGEMHPVCYQNYIDLFSGGISYHELICCGPDWAITYNIARADVYERTATGEVDSAMFAPTMEELCIMLFEWEWAYAHGSREPAATIAVDMINQLGIHEIRDEILAIERPMQLGAYLCGEPLVPLSYDPPIVTLPTSALRQLKDYYIGSEVEG